MDDMVYRQAAIDAIHKAVLEMFDFCDDIIEEPLTYTEEKMLEINKLITNKIRDLPSAQPEQAIAEWQKDFREYINMLNIPRDDYNGIMEYIDEVPSAQQKGKWIATQEWGGRNYSCSCCKFSFMVDTCMLEPMWNFCPNCGAEMVKGEEDE